MTDEEKFRFDLTGFLVRPAILERDEVDAIVDQIEKIHHNPESLPPEHRAVPGGPASVLIDHPKVLEVLHQIIGPDVRLENSFSVWRRKGQEHGGLHGGGPQQGDPIFGYRVNNGRIHAGMVRVVFELTDISKNDGATHFIAGSHKSNFPMHPDHTSLEEGKRSPFLMTYECPAGSAIFFTENLCHAGPIWQRETPRVAVLNAYAHLATHWHRLRIPPEVLSALPRESRHISENRGSPISVQVQRRSTQLNGLLATTNHLLIPILSREFMWRGFNLANEQSAKIEITELMV